ncbi:MAG: GNAT family N-acetyltransferase, partial [Pseudomonadota bacterium]|nr:GNAT family N-acetyltransferase [Pseudomonadota bacterium]
MIMKVHDTNLSPPEDIDGGEPIICLAQADPAFLADLHKGGFTSAFEQHWNNKAMAEMLAMPGVFIHQFSAGFIMTQISFETAEILTFTVLPSQRRKGYGVDLLKAAMLHA